MALMPKDKKIIIEEITEQVKHSLSIGMANHTNLKVHQITNLRKQANKMNVFVKVVRKKLATLAIENTSYKNLKEHITGPLLLAFAKEEMNAVAILFKQFKKDNVNFEIKNLSIPGATYEVEELEKIASLPTLDNARIRLLQTLKRPIEKALYVLHNIPKKLLIALVNIKLKKSLKS